MNDYLRLLKVLCDAQVRFVIIGGAAAAAQGATYPTYDLGVCYDRGRNNIERLANALKPFHPRLRGVPDDLPFTFDSATIARGMNFTRTTDLGDIDLFGEVAGIGGYKDVNSLSITLIIFGVECAVLSLNGLILSKRATARPKDLLVLPEIEALREMNAEAKGQTRPADDRNRGCGEDNKS